MKEEIEILQRTMIELDLPKRIMQQRETLFFSAKRRHIVPEKSLD